MAASTRTPVVSVIVAIAVVLGAACHHEREIKHHREKLLRLLERKLTVVQVEAEIGEAPFRVATPIHANELAQTWTNPMNSPEEVREKVRKWPQTRIYLKSPMVYVVYFDADGVMRDFSCLAN
jgi:hypothetical protein